MQLNFETWPIERCIDYARNPRKNDHAVDKVAAAIREFGFRVPIVAKSDGLVVDGHLRLKAAKKLGLTEVPVILADDMSEAQIKAFRLSVNKVAELAEWDTDLLGLEFSDLKEMGFDLELTGFEAAEIDALFPPEPTDGLTDEDAVPEVPEQPVTVEGDVWLLGRHRLMCGDSTSIDAVQRLMDGADWDVCVFDPPYELENLYDDAMPTAGRAKKLLVMWDFKRFAKAAVSAVNRGWEAQYEFIWDCVQSWYTPNRPLARHKAIGVFGDCPMFDTDAAVIQDGKRREAKTVRNTRGESNYVPLDGAKHIATVEAFPNTAERDGHGHGKPIKWIGAVFAGVGGANYLDLFGGSGATIVACEIQRRNCFCMELDPKYCDVIIKRWQDFTGQQATLEATGQTYDELKAEREAA